VVLGLNIGNGGVGFSPYSIRVSGQGFEASHDGDRGQDGAWTPLDNVVVRDGAIVVERSTEKDGMLFKLTILLLHFQPDIRNCIAQLTGCLEDLSCCKYSEVEAEFFFGSFSLSSCSSPYRSTLHFVGREEIRSND